MNAFSRRSFLKISAATILAGTSCKRFASQGKSLATGVLRKVPTFCDVCFWKCNAIATVRDEKLWKIEGNPNDPLCEGRLCPRGTGGIGAHTDPDRLRRPLIRTRERGEEKWKEVSWDEALSYIAERMQTIMAEHGPESLALFSHGLGGTLHAFDFVHEWGVAGTLSSMSPP